jgi:hypothetical protein
LVLESNSKIILGPGEEVCSTTLSYRRKEKRVTPYFVHDVFTEDINIKGNAIYDGKNEFTIYRRLQ